MHYFQYRRCFVLSIKVTNGQDGGGRARSAAARDAQEDSSLPANAASRKHTQH